TAWPFIGSSARIFNSSKSRVPCIRSCGLLMTLLGNRAESSIAPLGKQGERTKCHVGRATCQVRDQLQSPAMRSLVVSVAVILAGLSAPARGQEKVQVSVDVSKAGAKIDRNIFGQFAEHLGHGIYEGIWVGPDSPIPNTRGIRNDVVAALKAIKAPNVRWPGGCFADEYHWRKGIGSQRPETLNPNWGGVIEPNTFGTHEFMDFLDQIGAEAY